MTSKQTSKTLRLFELDSELYEFDAQVISCEERDGSYAIELDRTAFFPEGGGQYADVGTLDGVAVRDVQIEGDRILHMVDEPLAAGSTVKGVLDREERFVRMQNHSGEHILCGIAHTKWGAENVGFHLGDQEMTMDLDNPGEQPLGMQLQAQKFLQPFDFSILRDIQINIKLDVGASSYWSEMASMQTLDNLLMNKLITPEQYIERLPNGYINKKEELLADLRAARRVAAQPVPNTGTNMSVETTSDRIPVSAGSGNAALQRAINREGA